MAANATSVHNVSSSLESYTESVLTMVQVRANRTNIGSSGMSNDRSTMAKSFGGSKAWNSNIWGDNNLGNGFDGEFAFLTFPPSAKVLTHVDQHLAETAFEGKSGSGSLLSTSESDGWTSRPNLPWTTVNTSSSLARGTTAMNTSPVQARPNDRSASALSEAADAPSYFSLPRSGIAGAGGAANHKAYLNSASDGISPSTDGISFGGFGGFRNGDARHNVNSSAFGGSPVGPRFQMKPGMDTSSDDMTGSMAMSSLPQGLPDALAQQLPRNPYSHMPHSSASIASQRQTHTSHPSFQSENQGFDGRLGGGSMDLNAGLSKLQLNDGGFPTQRPSYMPHGSFDGSVSRSKYPQAAGDEGNYQSVQGYMGDGAADLLTYQTANRARMEGGGISPSELTRMESPFYSGLDGASLAGPHFRNASGSRLSEGQAAALERRLRAEAELVSPGNPLHRVQYPSAYDLANYQAARMNPLAGYYPASPLAGIGPAVYAPRPTRENDLSQVVRSPLLEEFRANSKGNKRYELKVSFPNDVIDLTDTDFSGHLQPCGGIQWRPARIPIHPAKVGNREQR